MNSAWSEQNKQVQQLLKKATFSQGIESLLSLRGSLMFEMQSWQEQFSPAHFWAQPFPNASGYHSKTVAYSLWHIFRIEDIVLHTLIQNDEEVFFVGNYQARIHAPIITTGNELVKEQIQAFSQPLDIGALYSYIQEVKASTDSWLNTLTYADLKTRFGPENRARIQALSVVSPTENAAWLMDYWCGKDIKGLIQIPFSRHWIMHTEASLRILNKAGATHA